MDRPKGVSFRARRGKGGVAASIIADALGKKIDADLSRILGGGATEADQMKVTEYLQHCEAQARRAQQ